MDNQDLGVDLLYEVGVDVMGYNISPFLFFIEIYNNDEGNRKEYFGFFSKGDSTALFGWVR